MNLTCFATRQTQFTEQPVILSAVQVYAIPLLDLKLHLRGPSCNHQTFSNHYDYTSTSGWQFSKKNAMTDWLSATEECHRQTQRGDIQQWERDSGGREYLESFPFWARPQSDFSHLSFYKAYSGLPVDIFGSVCLTQS